MPFPLTHIHSNQERDTQMSKRTTAKGQTGATKKGRTVTRDEKELLEDAKVLGIDTASEILKLVREGLASDEIMKRMIAKRGKQSTIEGRA